MADDVKWIKIKVGMFDGNSFKRIKRAKIDGVVDFRDKLTSVWFELLDLGGKVNNSGFLLNDEIAFRNYADIAIALDRTDKEIEMCINWFIDNNMMEIIDNLFLISNWEKYQNVDGLEKIRLQNNERQKKFRDKQKRLAIEMADNDNVSVTLRNAIPLIDNNNSNSLSNSNSKDKKPYGEFKNVKLTDDELEKLKGHKDYEIYIEKLSSYMASKDKRYKSHYATILNWMRKDEKPEVEEERHKGATYV